jgi:fructose-bisphosphate aldolase, class II
MLALGKALGDAQRGWVAIGHNVSDLVALKAVAAAARALNVPGLELPRASAISFGVREIATVVAALREETGQPIFLNADHTYSLEHALEAAKAGYDMIGFDVSTSPLEKNIELTQEAVKAVKSISPRIMVEGELGFVGSGSEIHESVPESSRLLMKADDAKRFVEITRIDVPGSSGRKYAWALKSMISGGMKKRLDIDRIGEIAAAVAIHSHTAYLHGGSGTDNADFKKAISAGITIVHIGTELRLAWRRGIEAALAAESDELVPYKSAARPSRPWRRSLKT